MDWTHSDQAEPLTSSDWQRVLEGHARARGVTGFQAHVLGPSWRPKVGSPILASDGDLWVRRIDIEPFTESSPGPATYVVLQPDGAMSEVVLPEDIGVAAIQGDLLLSVGQTEFGSHVVELWRF